MGNLIKKSGRTANKLAKKTGKVAKKSAEHVKGVFLGRLDNAHKVRRQVVSWVFVMAMLIFCAGLQQVWYRSLYEEDVFARGGTFAEATIGKIGNLNPIYATTNSELTVAKLLFSSLFYYDTSGSIKGDLAREITVSEDGRVHEVELRRGARWHDGEELSADDVIYTVETIQDPASRSVLANGLKNVRIEKVDDYCVKFVLPSSYVAFADVLTFPVIPKHILGETRNEQLQEHSFGMNPVGSGPFEFRLLQSVGKANERIVYMSVNTGYYLGRSMLDRFLVHTFETRSEVAAALDSQLVNATAELAIDNRELVGSDRINIRESSINNGVFAFLNTKSDALRSVNVRRAVRFGIDMEEIRNELTNVRPLDYPILDGQINFELPEFTIGHNVERAIELMREDGYEVVEGKLMKDGKRALISIATTNIGNYERIARVMGDQLARIGFEVEMNISNVSESGQDFLQNVLMARDYDVLIYEIEMGADPDMFAYYHSSQTGSSGLNLSEYVNKSVDDILLSARVTLDREMRRAKYESFIKKWMEDVPAIGIYQSNMAYFYNRETRVFSENNKLVSPLDRLSDVIYWAASRETVYKTP